MRVLGQEHHTYRLCDLRLLLLVTARTATASRYDLIILARSKGLSRLLLRPHLGERTDVFKRAADDLRLVEPLLAGSRLFRRSELLP